MERKARAFCRKPVLATDGPAGTVTDVYFDDARWSVRYFVVDTGHPMPRREVLVAPAHAAPEGPPLRVRLSRLELARCPAADEDKPVYLQHDIRPLARRGDPHLRSCGQFAGYEVLALDGVAGRVRDVIVDLERWAILGLAIDTGHWFAEREVVVAPPDVQSIDWLAHQLRVRLRREALRHRVRLPPRPATLPNTTLR
jgi:sporulation protein YlmC with PRC-barrel domain